MTAKNKLSRFSRNLLITACLVVSTAIVFAFYVRSEKQIDRANELRYLSFQLADELRQSSDDLTRMVRTYVVTGDPAYKKYYQDILDIRNGNKPRPEDYQHIYWDMVTANAKPPHPGSRPAIALLELMRQAGFTEQEFRKLAEANANSDGLTTAEFEAMKLIESGGPDAEAKRSKARMMMHDDKYHQAKAAIMKPIGEFYDLLDQRTLDTVQAAENISTILRYLFVALGLAVMFMLWRTYAALRDTLGGSVDEVYAQIAKIGSGDFSYAIPGIKLKSGLENSVLGWLLETQVKLSDIDRERKAAEAKILRLNQLYNMLSQCNQAVVHSANQEELFQHICRDAINIGGMKLAWIGLVDEASQRVVPAASYGEGVEYLEDIQIPLDAGDALGQDRISIVIRENQPFWCQDFMHDPLTAPRHELGARLGWAAKASLPLHRDGVAIGAFTLYSGTVNAFDEEARRTLVEMAMDISNALDHFAVEAERKAAELQLLEREMQYRTLADSGKALIWTSGTDKLCDYFNQPWLKFTGRTLEQELGNGWAEGVHPDDLAQCLATYAGAFDRHESFSMIYRLRHHDGEYRWIQDDGCPRYNAEGEFIGYIGYGLDITERKKMEIQVTEQVNELRRWREATMGREMRVLELKHEVNELLGQTGQPPRYPSAEPYDLQKMKQGSALK